MPSSWLKKISAHVALIAILFGFVSLVSVSSAERSDAFVNEERTEVISYKQIMKSYYDLAIQNASAPSLTLEEFENDYYSRFQAADLRDYTLEIAAKNGNYEEVCTKLNIEKRSSLVTGGGGGINGLCEDCILKTIQDYDKTPYYCFARPFFKNFYDYSALKVGDILFEEEGSVGSIVGHNALIVSVNHKSDYGDYIQTVEAVEPCVFFGFIDDSRMVQFRASVYRCKNLTIPQANAAVSFAKRQLGKTYKIRSLEETTIGDSATTWYCSELVFAALCHAGHTLSGCLVDGYIPPRALISSHDLERVYSNFEPYLRLSVEGKKQGKWQIRAYNPNSYSVTVEYNSKMCWLDDAQYWSGLKDVKETNCAPLKSVSFDIAENWFADSIGVSFSKETSNDSAIMNYRFVTYGKDLDSSKKTLSVWQHGILKKIKI